MQQIKAAQQINETQKADILNLLISTKILIGEAIEAHRALSKERKSLSVLQKDERLQFSAVATATQQKIVELNEKVFELHRQILSAHIEIGTWTTGEYKA